MGMAREAPTFNSINFPVIGKNVYFFRILQAIIEERLLK